MPSALPPYAQALGDGVFAVDTGFHRERFDAAYLLVQGGRAAFIDTGTNHAVPRLLATLDALGRVNGVGGRKLEAYGEAFLRAIRDHG